MTITQSLLLENANAIIGHPPQLIKNVDILLQNNKIHSISPSLERTDSQNARTVSVNASHYILFPGLINPYVDCMKPEYISCILSNAIKFGMTSLGFPLELDATSSLDSNNGVYKIASLNKVKRASWNSWFYLKQLYLELKSSHMSLNESHYQHMISSVTLVGAQALGMDKERGILDVGYAADMFFIKCDSLGSEYTLPQLMDHILETESFTTDIHAVLKNGSFLYEHPFSCLEILSDCHSTIPIFDSIQDAITEFENGNFIIVVDDQDRENEGDLIIAAQDVTPDKIAFMVRFTSGVLCVPTMGDRLDELELPLMVKENTETLKTAYTISVDYKHGTTTGISALDRCKTIREISNPNSKSTDFNRPGHVFPLKYTQGGVLVRPGHTEASIDFCRLAGKYPAAAISEIVLDSGKMARRDDLFKFAKQWNLKLVSIQDLISFIQDRPSHTI